MCMFGFRLSCMLFYIWKLQQLSFIFVDGIPILLTFGEVKELECHYWQSRNAITTAKLSEK